MLELDWIKQCILEQNYLYSLHADRERLADGLTLNEVEEAIAGGELLEEYADTGRGASCLIVGFTQTNRPIHSVVGRKTDKVVIITVYIPTPPKFITPFKRNRP